MNPACPPERRPAALTSADTAYLRALYGMDPETIAHRQRGSLVTRMTSEMVEGEGRR